jgi:hypothetical protein
LALFVRSSRVERDLLGARSCFGLVTKTRGAELRAAREVLGRTIATLKDRGKPGPEGILVEI